MYESELKGAKRRPIVTPSDTSVAVEMGVGDIERMLPHRPPMLLVDRISMVDLPRLSLQGHRRVDAHDPILAGHFPDYPIYPGALVLEAMGQASLCLHHLLEMGRPTVADTDRPRPVRLLRVLSAVFQGEVRPGDEMTLLAKRIGAEAFTMTALVQCLVAGQVVSYGALEVFLVDETEG